MTQAIQVANFLISLERQEHRTGGLTPMGLQKILYFLQASHLQSGTTLFDDAIRAGKYGPIVESVYSAFRPLGSSPIHQVHQSLRVDQSGQYWEWWTPQLTDYYRRKFTSIQGRRLFQLSDVHLMALSQRSHWKLTPQGQTIPLC